MNMSNTSILIFVSLAFDIINLFWYSEMVMRRTEATTLRKGKKKKREKDDERMTRMVRVREEEKTTITIATTTMTMLLMTIYLR